MASNARSPTSRCSDAPDIGSCRRPESLPGVHEGVTELAQCWCMHASARRTPHSLSQRHTAAWPSAGTNGARPVSTMRKDCCIQYSIELAVKYETGPKEAATGRGRTLTIGSKMVRFMSDRNLRPGRSILLRLAWPTLTADGTELNLWMSGEIIRSTLWVVEVRVSRYEFRTRRRSESTRVPVPERPQAGPERASGV